MSQAGQIRYSAGRSALCRAGPCGPEIMLFKTGLQKQLRLHGLASFFFKISVRFFFLLLVPSFALQLYAATVNETFDSASSAASHGWVGLGNTNDGNNYGWSGTTFA